MSSSGPSVNAALAAAQDKVRATVDAALVEVANNLLTLMKSAGTYRERGQLAFAQIHILENRALFLSSFTTSLGERIEDDIARRSENGSPGETDGSRSAWSTKARSRKRSLSSASASRSRIAARPSYASSTAT